MTKGIDNAGEAVIERAVAFTLADLALETAGASHKDATTSAEHRARVIKARLRQRIGEQALRAAAREYGERFLDYEAGRQAGQKDAALAKSRLRRWAGETLGARDHKLLAEHGVDSDEFAAGWESGWTEFTEQEAKKDGA